MLSAVLDAKLTMIRLIETSLAKACRGLKEIKDDTRRSAQLFGQEVDQYYIMKKDLVFQ